MIRPDDGFVAIDEVANWKREKVLNFQCSCHVCNMLRKAFKR